MPKLGPDQLFGCDPSLLGRSLHNCKPLHARLWDAQLGKGGINQANQNGRIAAALDQIIVQGTSSFMGFWLRGFQDYHRITVPRQKLVGTMPGQIPYLYRKTFQYSWNTQTAQQATNTTIGTSTPYVTESQTLYVPETAERTFESVRLIVTARTVFSVTNTMVGAALSFQLGAAAVETFQPALPSIASASHNTFIEQEYDLTSYFNRNFGTGGSQTAVAQLALATASAANFNGATFTIIGTYAFNPNSAPARLKVLRFPIQSHMNALTNAQQEIGCDGTTAPAPSGQIPILNNLPEQGKVFRQIYLEFHGNDACAAAANITPQFQLDATAEVALAPIDTTLIVEHYWRHNQILSGLDTSVTHTVNLRCDTVTTNKLFAPGAFLVVVFEYNLANTISNGLATYEWIGPLVNTVSDSTQGGAYDSLVGTGVTAQYYAEHLFANVEIQEPGPITLLQSGAVTLNSTQSSVGLFSRRCGQQQFRGYTPNVASIGHVPVISRGDIANGWTLTRGMNKLPVDIYSLGRSLFESGWAIVNYTAGIQGDPDAGNHPLNYLQHISEPAISLGIDSTRNNGYVKTPSLGARWRITGAMMEIWTNVTAAIGYGFGMEQAQGEGDASVALVWTNTTAQFGCINPSIAPIGRMINPDHLHTGSIDITQPRRQVYVQSSSSISAGWSLWLTVHHLSFNVNGQVTQSGSPVPAGTPVKVYAQDNTLAGAPMDYLTTVTTDASGNYSFQALDNTRTYFTTAQNGSVVGRSADGTAGSSTFNITMGAASPDVIITGTPVVQSASGSATFTFTISTGTAEYNVDGGAYTPTTSPINLAGLSNGPHTINIRSQSVPSVQQSFTWTVNTSSGDVTPPTITIVSPPAGSTIGPSTQVVFQYADNTGLRRPMPCIKIRQPDNTFKYELIHDGDNFTPDYQGVKTIVQASPPIWQYSVQRKGGWAATLQYAGVQTGDAIQLVPFGTDTAGNEPT